MKSLHPLFEEICDMIRPPDINPESFYLGFEEPENEEFKFDLDILEELERNEFNNL